MKIKQRIIKVLKEISHSFGVEISRYETDSVRARKLNFDKWETLSEFLIIHLKRLELGLANERESKFIRYIVENYRKSKSQIFQDLLVLFLSDNKKNGFFVEFGATNGISFSNTYLLENSLGWKGILAEPGKKWQKDLKFNRACLLDHRCLWESSGEQLVFNETECAELSTVDELTKKDSLAKARINRKTYSVESVSLNDLLLQNKAPFMIDFMSIDTEGSELRILENFNFDKYDIKIICVEHNYCEPDRSEICNLLTRNGFERIFQVYSHFDDWYCKQ